MKYSLLLGSLAAGMMLAEQTNAQLSAAPRRLLRTSSNTTDGSDFGMDSSMSMIASMLMIASDDSDFGMDSSMSMIASTNGGGGKHGVVKSKSKKTSKSGKSTPFDWCPDSRVSPLADEVSSNESKLWDHTNPFEKDKAKKLFKVPDAGGDGWKDSGPEEIVDGPVIEEIVGGTDVNPPRKYKFFALLNGCGGSLVAPNVVLSAAHCDIGVSDYVTLGMHKRVIDAGEVTEFSNLEHIPIKQSVRHPCYNDDTLEYDFWVIELEWSTQKYKDNIVELDTPTDALDLDDGSPYQLTVMGFGSLFGENFTFPNSMQEVTLDYIPNDSCGNSGLITDSMLCAGSLGQDNCFGDLGGPIIDSDTQKQVGVVSGGNGDCLGDPAYPGVYARVSVGYDWISTYITQWEADVPAPAPGVCVDDPEGWFDSDGPKYNCLWYASNNRCARDGDSFANGGVTANMACCACTTLDYPDGIDGTGEYGTASFDVTFGYTGSYTAAAHGLEPATVTSGNVAQGDDQVHQFELSGAALFRITIPPEAVANPDIDLDIFLVDPLGREVAISGNNGTDELVEFASPMDGTWLVLVNGYNTTGPSADYDMYSWVISATPGVNMNVDSATEAVSGATGTVDISWTGATEDEWHLGAVSHTFEGILFGLTHVNVDNRIPG